MNSFSSVVMFLHRDENLLDEFVVITTVCFRLFKGLYGKQREAIILFQASGKSIKLMTAHLIYVFNCGDVRTFPFGDFYLFTGRTVLRISVLRL